MKTELKKQRDFESNFRTWYEDEAKPLIDDARRRYRMQLEDEEERKDRGLSALASTKSTSAVDRAVEKAILEYHGEPDAISFTAKMGGNTETDLRAKWLTEDFKYRADHTFPFALWNVSSLTACFADGLEAALVSWRKEAYTDTQEAFVFSPDGVTTQEIPEEIYQQYAPLDDRFLVEEKQIEVPVKDTWWIDQLKPGEDLLWDIKSPLLDLNMGEAHLVKIPRSLNQIIELSESGLFDKVKPEELKKYQGEHIDTARRDQTATAGDPDDYDFGDLNRIEVWVWFEKVKCRWMVSFSVEGKLPLSDQRPVDDVFFNGRKVNILPLFLGTSKLKLWEALGRGLPETIAPVEDEWIDHRNNLNDAAKMAIQGRWRLNSNSDIDLDSLLNERVFYANAGDAELINQEYNIGGALRAADAITADFNELVPVGMDNRQMVPKGSDKTLGAIQLAIGAGNEKLSVALMVRNITFFKPLLHCIAQMTIAWETDENILRIAAAKVKQDQQQWQPPQVDGMIDFRALDLDVEVSINAGLGSVPKQQKANTIIQLVMMGSQAGIPVDTVKAFKQLSVLAGFEEDTFLGEAPQPSGPEMKVDLNLDFSMLSGNLPLSPMQQQILQMILNGASEIGTDINASPPNEMKNMMQNMANYGTNYEPDLTSETEEVY